MPAPASERKLRATRGTQRNLGFKRDELQGKPPAALNQFGRDPASAAENERAQSNWLERDPRKWTARADKAVTGFTALPHSFFADLPRLCRSVAEMTLLLYTWKSTFGAEPEKRRGARPAMSAELLYTDLASIMNCSVRQVFENIEDALNRLDKDGNPAPLIAVKRTGRGVQIQLLLDNWERAVSHQDMPKAAAANCAPRTVPQSVEITPFRFESRHQTNPIPLSYAVRSIQFRDNSPENTRFSADISAEIISGNLVVTTTFDGVESQADQREKQPSAETLENARNGHFANGRLNQVNEIAHPPLRRASLDSPHLRPQKYPPEALEIRRRLVILGYSFEPKTLDELMGAIPVGCNPDFAMKTVDERRRRSTPLTAVKLPAFFRGTVATLWEQAKDRYQAAAPLPAGVITACKDCGGSGLVGADWQTLPEAIAAVTGGAKYCSCKEGDLTKCMVEPELLRNGPAK